MTSPTRPQAFIEPPAPFARFHVLELRAPDADPRAALIQLAATVDLAKTVVGIGEPLALRLGRTIQGLRAFPALTGPGVAVPSTQGALLVVHGGDDLGTVHHHSRALCQLLSPAFRTLEVVDAFVHRGSRDLTGYEDGTENPKADAAWEAAVIRGRGPGLDGGSFVAVQRWVHELEVFASRSQLVRDHTIGRRLADNEEIADAPACAHVKRSAQESFDPPAFMLRRSMAFVSPSEQGLCFVAYGESLDRFERVLRRMLGQEDGITDAMFTFTQPRSGGYYFCPPVHDRKLDLLALGLGAEPG